MKKRIFALFVTIVMVVGILPLGTVAAEAHEHSCEDGDYTTVDSDSHSYICSCGEEVVEDCTFDWDTWNDENHMTGCAHCYNFIFEEPHNMVDCECTYENCGYKNHTVETWTAFTDEYGSHHTGHCSSCDKDIVENHSFVPDYTESEHWWVCVDCGYVEEEPRKAHTSFSDWFGTSGNQHYCYCEGCGYKKHAPHVDENGDGICDIETCSGEVCVDSNKDHVCDVCDEPINYLCTDANGDHSCDADNCAIVLMYEECTDTNDDHVCDEEKCARHMLEVCIDENGDYLCDECGENCCYHFLPSAVNNKNGTHSGVCEICSENVTVRCLSNYSDIYYIVSADAHIKTCICGYKGATNAHVYKEEYYAGSSAAGHWFACDHCYMEKFEPHKASDGVCELCGHKIVETFDVYVGGVGLKDGQYINKDLKVSASKPKGGYAYYKDGTLELNGFTYTGVGILWQKGDGFESYSPIFTTKDIVLKLTGENRLSSTAKTVESDEDEEDELFIYGDGIASVGKITVTGDGSLTIHATDDGIQITEGDFVMESGTLILGSIEYNSDGSVKSRVDIGDDGIDLDVGSMTFGGGTLSITAYDHGVDANGAITVSGGAIVMNVGDDGLESDGTVTIEGGSLDITAADISIVSKKLIIPEKTDEPTPDAPTSENEKDPQGGADAKIIKNILIITACIVIALAIAFGVIFVVKKKKKTKN